MSQLSASSFTAYSSVDYTTITAGPDALYSISVDGLLPTQLNEGFAEVDKKADGFDDLTPSQLQANLLTDIEPVVIGPGGKLYLTDGHHTFTALEDSVYGASNPTVYVNVIANYSNLTESQFFATMQANNLLLPLNDNVAESVNDATGAPIPTSLTGLTSDVYRGLEYSILKNKSSKLFTTSSNLTGQTGAAISGLDKMTGFYSDFLEAAAYQDANGGLGLPYLSPGDIALATQWNLTGSDLTTLPNVSGSVHVYQLPGYILPASLNESTFAPGGISNTTLASGALDGNGTFTGITQINAGTAANPILIGTPNTGFIMQLGNDNKGTVTLTSGNTYTGGTSILAGTLIITDDTSLGAAAPANAAIDPNNVKTSVQADNGIVFNSLTEGNGTLQIGTTSGNGTASFSTSRPIAVGGEAANINLNGYLVTLNGAIASLGTDDTGIGNATGFSDLTVEDTSSTAKGVLILPSSANNADFYGNWIVTTGTLRASSDASLGNTTSPSYTIGQIVLNGGTFQAGASFSSVRTVSVQSKSIFDTAGYTTSFAGALSDIQRNLTITNSGSGAGAVSFGSLQIGSALELTVSKGSGASTGVTFTSGIQQSAASDQLLLAGLSSTATVADGTAPALTDGIVAPWIVIDSGAATNPYDFATYGANGFTAFTGYAANIATATGTSVVKQSSNVSLSAANTQAYALNIQSGVNVTIGTGKTLTLGNGTSAGLILNDGASSGLTGGTLAFGTAEADVTVTGSAGNTITSAITGSGGLNLDGTGTVTLSTASTESGLVTVNSGTLVLTGSNIFSADAQGVLLQDTKNLAAAKLTVSANNQFAALNSTGNNSTVTISGGAVLTIGDPTSQNSTLSSTITETGAATAGALTKAGTGLLDISGSGGVTLISGSTVNVTGGALRIANGIFSISATNAINLAAGTELQYEGNGGSKFNDPITGQGTFHLLAGTVQLTSTGNTYSGGTVIESGATLDVTTANLPNGGNVVNAGGVLDFDQTTSGAFTGVMSDGLEAGGPNDPDTLASAAYGPSLSGTLIKDDSTGANSGNVTIGAVQTYSGATYIEAGTLTLGAANAIANSSGVTLGRVGTSTAASLALTANNTLASLSSDASSGSVVETTSVNLNSYALTLDPGTGTAATFAGTITGTGGSLIEAGTGTETLTGTNSFTGGITLESGTLELGSNAAAGSGAITFNGPSAELKLDAMSASFAGALTTFAIGDKIDLAGLTYQAGTASASVSGSALIVTNGTATETFTLSNLAGGTTFAVTSDGAGGTLVTGAAPFGLTAGGNGGAGDYGYAGGQGGTYLYAGSAGKGAKTYQQITGSGGGGGGAGAVGAAGGIGGVGEGAGAGGAAGQAGVNAYGTGIGGRVKPAGPATLALARAAAAAAAAVPMAHRKRAPATRARSPAARAARVATVAIHRANTAQSRAAAAAAGAGGFGLLITGAGTSSSNAALVTGGAGGSGGAGDVGGNGGGGGVGVYFTNGAKPDQ